MCCQQLNRDFNFFEKEGTDSHRQKRRREVGEEDGTGRSEFDDQSVQTPNWLVNVGVGNEMGVAMHLRTDQLPVDRVLDAMQQRREIGDGIPVRIDLSGE